jgi:hypothetical protein
VEEEEEEEEEEKSAVDLLLDCTLCCGCIRNIVLSFCLCRPLPFFFFLFEGGFSVWGRGRWFAFARLGKNWGRFGHRTIAKVLFRNGGAFVAAATGVSSDAFAAPLPAAAAARSAVPATSSAR